MKYINPLAILGLSAEKAQDGIDKAFLKREKKRLLAEFELQQATVIEVAGQKLDKATVLELFEMLEDEAQVEHHIRVLRNPGLMNFLEDASLDYFYSGDISMLPANPDSFLEFIAPAFADKYNQRLFHAFRQKDWEEIEIMCTHPLVIPARYHAPAFQDTFRHIHSRIEEIDEITGKISDGLEPDGKVQEIGDEILISSLNRLPDYFSGSRDRYGNALEGLALAVFNTHRRAKLAIFILRQGLKLNASTETKDRLNHVLDQLLKMEPTDSFFDSLLGEKGEDNSTMWWVAAGIGAAVVVLASWWNNR